MTKFNLEKCKSGNKGITLIALIITIIVLLILAGITINSLTGSDSAPAKANEAAQKNDIGTAKDEISLLAVNAKTEGYETAYVGNGVSAGDASKTVGQAVIDAVKAKNGTNVGKASISVEQTTKNEKPDDAKITITTRDFEVIGTITINDGILTWGEVEANIPGIKDVPETLTMDTWETKTINATLKGITGTITWTSSDEDVATVSNGVIRAADTLKVNDQPVNTATVIITATLGNYSESCNVTVHKVVVGDIVNYAPSRTYDWNCNLAESGDNASTAINTLSSGENGAHRITQWKILNYNQSTKMVEMVPSEVPTKSSTNRLTLRGAQGYNNAVYLLNSACNSLYGKGTTITARSINEEDFINASAIDNTDTDNGGNKWLNYREKTYENSSVKNANNTNVKYGQQKNGAAYTLSSYRNYPVMYAYDYNSVITPEPTLSTATASLAKSLGLSVQNNPISKTQDSDSGKDGYKKASTSIQPYQTYYKTGSNSTTRGLLDSEKANVLVPDGNSQYWVASRCVNLGSSGCSFYVRDVNSGYLNATCVFSSETSTHNPACALFPVVSLSSELLEPSSASGVAWEVDAN